MRSVGLETAFHFLLRLRSLVLTGWVDIESPSLGTCGFVQLAAGKWGLGRLTHRLLDLEFIELGLIPGNLSVELSRSVAVAGVLVEPLSPAFLLSF